MIISSMFVFIVIEFSKISINLEEFIINTLDLCLFVETQKWILKTACADSYRFIADPIVFYCSQTKLSKWHYNTMSVNNVVLWLWFPTKVSFSLLQLLQQNCLLFFLKCIISRETFLFWVNCCRIRWTLRMRCHDAATRTVASNYWSWLMTGLQIPLRLGYFCNDIENTKKQFTIENNTNHQKCIRSKGWQ